MQSFPASKRSSPWHRQPGVCSVGLSKGLLRGLLSPWCWDAGCLTASSLFQVHLYFSLNKQEGSIGPLILSRRVDGREDLERDSEQLGSFASDQNFNSFFSRKNMFSPSSLWPGSVPCVAARGVSVKVWGSVVRRGVGKRQGCVRCCKFSLLPVLERKACAFFNK